jgi:hypothetical protein
VEEFTKNMKARGVSDSYNLEVALVDAIRV